MFGVCAFILIGCTFEEILWDFIFVAQSDTKLDQDSYEMPYSMLFIAIEIFIIAQFIDITDPRYFKRFILMLIAIIMVHKLLVSNILMNNEKADGYNYIRVRVIFEVLRTAL